MSTLSHIGGPTFSTFRHTNFLSLLEFLDINIDVIDNTNVFDFTALFKNFFKQDQLFENSI